MLTPSINIVKFAKVLGCYSPSWSLCDLWDVSTPGNMTCLMEGLIFWLCLRSENSHHGLQGK